MTDLGQLQNWWDAELHCNEKSWCYDIPTAHYFYLSYQVLQAVGSRSPGDFTTSDIKQMWIIYAQINVDNNISIKEIDLVEKGHDSSNEQKCSQSLKAAF